jgi:hypothetical protein
MITDVKTIQRFIRSPESYQLRSAELLTYLKKGYVLATTATTRNGGNTLSIIDTLTLEEKVEED